MGLINLHWETLKSVVIKAVLYTMHVCWVGIGFLFFLQYYPMYRTLVMPTRACYAEVMFSIVITVFR